MSNEKTFQASVPIVYGEGKRLSKTERLNGDMVKYQGKRRIEEVDNRPYWQRESQFVEKPKSDTNTQPEKTQITKPISYGDHHVSWIGFIIMVLLFSVLIGLAYAIFGPSSSTKTSADKADVFNQEISRLKDEGFRIKNLHMVQKDESGDITLEPIYRSWYFMADRDITMDVYNKGSLVHSYKLTANVLWDLGKYDYQPDDRLSLHFTGQHNNTRIVFLARYSW